MVYWPNAGRNEAIDGDLPVAVSNFPDTGGVSTSSTYRATTNGAYDGSLVYASANTLTLAGTPHTVYSEDLVYVLEVDSTGGTARIWVNGAGGVVLTIAAGVVTMAGGVDFSATGEHTLGYGGQDKAHTASTNSTRTEEVDPLNLQAVNYNLVDTTNVAAATNYYPSSDGIEMAGARQLSITGKFIDADGTMTLSLEVSNDEDATPANRDWIAASLLATDLKTGVQVITAALTVTNGTLTFGLLYKDLNVKYARIVMVNDGATNTAIIKARAEW